MHPTELGRYRIVKPLGRGGMGVVYEAHDPRIDRPVAIKTIALSGLDAHETAMFEARFEAEMRFAGRLQHQNIAALYDTGRDGDTAYIVMELVPGQDLRRLLAAGRRFEPDEAIGIVGQLLAALDYAHRRQVIHRDVKPANVMLQDDGLVKLCDFGVARPADAEATRTQGVMVGSLHYSSPEQIAGLPIDIRTDLFSTGALLFELLTGERPFKGATEAEVLNRIANADAPSCRSLAPQVPPAVDAAIRRALSKRPADRFDSAEAFAEALGVPLFGSTATGTLPLRPPPPGHGTAAMPVARATSPRRLAWIAGGLVTGSAAVVGLMLGRVPSGPAPAALLPVAQPASAPASQASTAVAAVAAVAPMVPAPVAVERPADPASAVPAAVPTAAAGSSPTASGRAASASPDAPTSRAPPASAPPAARAERVAAASPAPAASRPLAAPPLPANWPGQGPWQARVTCGPIQSSTAAKGSEGFSTAFPVEVDWPRLGWQRETAVVTSSMAGRFDEAGRFQGQGQGSRKDRVEVWLERAEGHYLPSSRSIVGRIWLLRPKDNSVARECQFAVGVGVAPATVAAASASGAVARTAAPASASLPPRPASSAAPGPRSAAVPQGDWEGELSCGALVAPDASASGAAPFVNPVLVTVDGNRVRYTRDRPTVTERAEGSIDGANRFSAEGMGRYTQRRGQWTVKVQGEFLAQPARLQGQVQVLRVEDGRLARECSLRARPRR
jgi:serine/threonine-protein kinase